MKRLTCLVALFGSIVGLGCGAGSGSSSQLPAPSNLSASIIASGVHLTWTDNSADETEFQIERKVFGGQFAKASSTVANVAQYDDVQAPAGSLYVYRVRAMAGSTPSDYSNEMSILVRTPGPASFKSDIVPMFNRSCGTTASGCHARDSYAATLNMGCRGWLSLEDAPLGATFYSGPKNGQSTGCTDRTLYQRLTQFDAWMCSSPLVKYITPSSTAQSRIHQIVAGNPTGNNTCEKSPGVPNTAMPPAPAPSLSAGEIQLLADWINQGALNN